MHKTFVVIASIALPLAFGCKGCEKDRPSGKPEVAQQTITHPTQSDDAKRTARLNGRHLDRGKDYPKNADGKVACGNDVDCFVVQAEKCAPADLDNTLRGSVFGIQQSVAAEYHILGSDADRCKMTRHVTAVSVQLDAKLAEALRKQHKTDEDLATMKADSERALQKHNPEMLTCEFDMEQALSVALDIAESKPNPQPWRESCKEIASARTPAAAPAPAAKPAPAKPAQNP
jgi:hypothetical protein